MPATVLYLECKSYVIVGIFASISEFPLMCGDVQLTCGDVWWCAVFRHSRCDVCDCPKKETGSHAPSQECTTDCGLSAEL